MKKRALIVSLAVFCFCGLARAQQQEQAKPLEQLEAQSQPGQTAAAAHGLRLTLDDCLKLGLENSPQIKMSQANVDYAKGKVVSARSELIPKINASGTYTRTNMLTDFKVGEPTYIPTSYPMATPSGPPLPPDHLHLVPMAGFEMTNDREGDVYNMKIETTYPLFTGFRTTEAYKVSKLALDSSAVSLNQQRQTLVFQIKQTFYQTLLAQEMIKVVDQAYATMEDHYKQVTALYREGYVSNLDLLQVEAELSAIKPQQIQAHNNLQLAKVAMGNLLYLEPETEFDLVGTLDYLPGETPELDQALEQARENRPELKNLALQKKQARSLIRIAQGGYLPTVALFANYQWNRGQDLPPNDTVWEKGYQAGVNASIPVFDAFYSYGETKAAKGQYLELSWAEQAARAGVETEVTSSYLNIITAKESVEAQKVNVQAAEKNFDAAERRYREGYTNQLDVLDAETKLTQAKAGYLNAVSNYLVAKAALDKAMGTEADGK